jgi:NAD(P)-dependent dehydrogenase (short-subunit alcohol dehydrogenase family)
MAEAGAAVILAGRSPETLEAAHQEVSALGAAAIVVRTDITRHEDLLHLRDAALERFGYIHCWVNNAGSADPADVGPLIDLDEGQWDRVVDLNLKWTFFACQIAARAMTRGGSIVNISSRSGQIANPMTGQYGAAKAGLDNLTQTMAIEWGHLGVRVNGVAPGVVFTEEAEKLLAKGGRLNRQLENVPLRRLGRPEDIGYACVYLAADESSFVTGETLVVCGGGRIAPGHLSYLYHVNERMEAEAVGLGSGAG